MYLEQIYCCICTCSVNIKLLTPCQITDALWFLYPDIGTVNRKLLLLTIKNTIAFVNMVHRLFLKECSFPDKGLKF